MDLAAVNQVFHLIYRISYHIMEYYLRLKIILDNGFIIYEYLSLFRFTYTRTGTLIRICIRKRVYY